LKEKGITPQESSQEIDKFREEYKKKENKSQEFQEQIQVDPYQVMK